MYRNNARDKNKTHDSTYFVLWEEERTHSDEDYNFSTKETFKAKAPLKFDTSNV